MQRNSRHDAKILRGIFTGFLHRAYTDCEGEHLREEIDFLIKCFVENGYEERQFKQIHTSYMNKRNNGNEVKTDELQKIVTLPWIPELS